MDGVQTVKERVRLSLHRFRGAGPLQGYCRSLRNI